MHAYMQKCIKGVHHALLLLLLLLLTMLHTFVILCNDHYMLSRLLGIGPVQCEFAMPKPQHVYQNPTSGSGGLTVQHCVCSTCPGWL